jgi:hypothetical protein
MAGSHVADPARPDRDADLRGIAPDAVPGGGRGGGWRPLAGDVDRRDVAPTPPRPVSTPLSRSLAGLDVPEDLGAACGRVTTPAGRQHPLARPGRDGADLNKQVALARAGAAHHHPELPSTDPAPDPRVKRGNPGPTHVLPLIKQRLQKLLRVVSEPVRTRVLGKLPHPYRLAEPVGEVHVHLSATELLHRLPHGLNKRLPLQELPEPLPHVREHRLGGRVGAVQPRPLKHMRHLVPLFGGELAADRLKLGLRRHHHPRRHLPVLAPVLHDEPHQPARGLAGEVLGSDLVAVGREQPRLAEQRGQHQALKLAARQGGKLDRRCHPSVLPYLAVSMAYDAAPPPSTASSSATPRMRRRRDS